MEREVYLPLRSSHPHEEMVIFQTHFHRQRILLNKFYVPYTTPIPPLYHPYTTPILPLYHPYTTPIPPLNGNTSYCNTIPFQRVILANWTSTLHPPLCGSHWSCLPSHHGVVPCWTGEGSWRDYLPFSSKINQLFVL